MDKEIPSRIKVLFKGEFVKRFISILVLSVLMVVGISAQSISLNSIGYADATGEIVSCTMSDGNGYICKIDVVNSIFTIYCAYLKNYDIVKSVGVSGVPTGISTDSNNIYTFYVQGKKITQKIQGDYMVVSVDSLITGMVFIFSSN